MPQSNLLPRLVLSIQSYNEIANIFDQMGVKVNDRQSGLMLDKGTILVPPVDIRQATIRRDVLIEAIKALPHFPNVSRTNDFVDFCETLYQWVYKGDKPQTEDKGWK